MERNGPERARLWQLTAEGAVLELSAIAWYEFSRGPRTPQQLAVARTFFRTDGIVGFDEELARLAADRFRALGSPRRRAADIAIGVTALRRSATLLTRNARDFDGLPGLRLEAVPPD